MMKKILAILAVATIPASLSGCATCCPTSGLGLCPCCPCNWFNRPAPACPPAPVCCPPAPTYAAPLAATACPPPCAPMCPPVASQMMPQYVMPTSAPYASAPCCGGQMGQPMYASPAYYAEPGCGFNAAYMEPGCGGPMMGAVSYGMPMECGACGGCSSGCCDGGTLAAPPAENFVEPRPAD